VTASSQGSILPGESSDQSSIYSSHDPSYPNFVSQQQAEVVPAATEIIDFTYVNVFETDADEVDVMMDGRDPCPEADTMRGDVLAVLLSGGTQDQDGESIVVRIAYDIFILSRQFSHLSLFSSNSMQSKCEKANEAAHRASESKRKGDLTTALNAHTEAAKLFREAAVSAREGDGTCSMWHLLNASDRVMTQ
jgi:hypothetical protein